VSHPRAKRALAWVAGALAVVLVVVGVGGYLLYRHLSGNIAHQRIDVVEPRPDQAPGKAENILVMGSDTRAFKGGSRYGSDITGARSDTTILVHIYATGDKAVLVSIPRDTYTLIPRCRLANGSLSAPQHNKFNAAFSIGGPSCTIATVEHLTHLRIDHYVVVNFAGFQHMVDALGGVDVCVRTAIHDPIRYVAGHYEGSGLELSAGTHKLEGKQALEFVRARYGVGDGSDLGRIKNQQVFISSLIRKATGTGLLLHPFELYQFLNAATKSIETDPGFGIPQLKGLAGKLHGLQAGKVQLLTVPLSNPNAYVPIGGVPASVVFWDEKKADAIWSALRQDAPLPGTATTPSPRPSASASPSAPAGASPSASPLTVAPQQVHVAVLNGTGQQGLAARAAAALRSEGFVVDQVGNADRSDYTTTEVRYGSTRADSARTLAAAVPGSVTQADPTLGTTLTLVLGSDYSGTHPVQVQSATPAPSATPSLDVVTADRDVCAG
jgi:LCP family protein required for cell wall assembly